MMGATVSRAGPITERMCSYKKRKWDIHRDVAKTLMFQTGVCGFPTFTLVYIVCPAEALLARGYRSFLVAPLPEFLFLWFICFLYSLAFN